VRIPPGARRFDVRGMFIVPGFIDTHAHWGEIRKGVLDVQNWSFLANLASKRPVAGLILEGGFPSAGRVVQRTMGLPGLHLVIRSKFDSAAKLKEISVPVLVAHCTRDPILPYALGEELYAAANQPKTFVSYDSDYHEPFFFANPVDYAARLRAFLETATKAQGPRD